MITYMYRRAAVLIFITAIDQDHAERQLRRKIEELCGLGVYVGESADFYLDTMY